MNEATRILGATGAWIRLLEGEVMLPGAATESAANFLADAAELNPVLKVGEGQSSIGHVMATKKVLVFEEIAEGELVSPGLRALFQKHGFHGIVMVPLLANGQSVGVLVLSDSRVRRFTEDEVSLLTAFADQASLALEKARLLNDAEREKGRLVALAEVVSDLATTSDFEAVSQKITNSARSLISGNHHRRFTEDFPLSDLGSIRAFAAREHRR